MIKLARLDNRPEIFYTIQGEGKNVGVPSVFIRLSLCNLYCVWCDTDYTWNWEGTAFTHVRDQEPGYAKFKKEDYQLLLNEEEIFKVVESYHCRNIVLTGGEPMVQQKDLIALLMLLKSSSQSHHIEVETNGTLAPIAKFDELVDQYNVSVKLSNTEVSVHERLKPDVIRFFAETPKSNFKFVIDSEHDMEEVIDVQKRYHILPHKIYLMPQGTTVDNLKSRQLWLVEKCKEHHFNYTDRIHIHIYGNKRGV